MTNLKPVFALFGCLLTGLASCQPQSQNLSTSDIDAIRLASDAWVETYNQNAWSDLSSLFSEDATMMPPNNISVSGRAAIAAWEIDNESGFRIAFDIQEISGRGDMAYIRGRSCTFIPLGNGEFGVDVGKFLEIRKKQSNGQWLIQADIFNSDIPLGGELLSTCPFAELP